MRVDALSSIQFMQSSAPKALDTIAAQPAEKILENLPKDQIELSKMHQGYQANAKMVQTADEMLGTALDLIA